jgi:hypothetical protein
MTSRRAPFDLIAVLLAVFIAAGALLYLYYPATPHSILGWLALFGLGLPTWGLLECLGDLTLQNGLFRRLSSSARIALGVPTLLALITVSIAIIWLGGRIIERL